MPRPQLFSFALALALSGLLASCGSVVREVRKANLGLVAPPPSDMARARTAWAYFEGELPAEYARGAGFVTPASIGDDIAATYAARRLGLIGRAAFDRRIASLLGFLAAAPLAGGVLPGRYHNLSGELIDPPRAAADPGWSAVEIGRLLVWLKVLSTDEPRHAAAVTAVVGRWQLCRAIDAEGNLLRALPANAAPGAGLVTASDAGTGYAGIAALGFNAWGVAARRPAVATGEFSVDVNGVAIGLPSGPQVEPLLTAPAALNAMVFGWAAPAGSELIAERQQAAALAEAQHRRGAVGVPTARTSFRRRTAPFMVENSVLAGGFPWSTIGDGVARPDLALVSVEAAFGLRALTGPSGYGDRVVGLLGQLQGRRGWSEGQYENGSGPEPLQTAATNAMVLEAVLYRQAGMLYRGGRVVPVSCAAGQRP